MKTSTRSFYQSAIERVLAALTASLDEAPELAALARLAGLSPFHFHRVFRGLVRETPLELLRRLRLERAAAELLASDGSITAIAFRAGFESHEGFTRAFHQAFGEPPSAFRSNGHARPLLASPNGLHFRAGRITSFELPPFGDPPMDVRLEYMQARRLAVVRHTGPYNQIGRAFERLGALAGPAGLLAHPGAAMIGRYHDDPEATPPEALRSDAGITVPEGVPIPAPLEEAILPAGNYARYAHIGPFETLGDAWSRFMGGWLPASGHRLGEGPAYEFYVSDMRTTPKEQLQTDLVVPLAQ